MSAQDPLAGFEQGVFEVVANRLAPVTVLVLVDSAGSLLLPVSAVADYVGLPLQREAEVWRVARIRGAGALLLATRTIIAGPDTLELPPAQFVVTADDVYLHVEQLARLLEGRIDVDFSRLTAVLSRDPPFPAQQRIELEQRRTVMRGPAHGQQGSEMRFGASRYTGLGTLDWDLATSGLDPTRLSFARLQAGGALLGGGLTAGGTLQVGREARGGVSDRFARYHRVFESPWLSQAEVGRFITHGLYTRFVDGVEITNAPYLRDYDLGEIVLRPDLPAGWQYEVLQGPQLLGYSEPGGAAVAVPLRTGSTPVDVRFIGPAGEEVVERLVYQTPVGLLERGRLQYVLGGGRCRDSSCNEYGHADLRWGGWSRLTLGAGTELLTDTAGRIFRPYVVGSFTTGTFLTGEVHMMPDAAYRGTFAAWLAHATVARLNTGLARPGYRRVAALTAPGHRWDVDLSIDHQLSTPVVGARALRLFLNGLGQQGERPRRWAYGAASTFAGGYGEIRHERSNVSPDILSLRASRSFRIALAGFAARPTFTGSAGVGRVGMRFFEAGTILQPLPNAAIAISGLWNRASGAGFSIAWNSRLGPAQASVRTAASQRGDPTSAIGLSGSVAWAPPSGIRAEPVGRIGYAGVRGVVFLDEDGDSRHDPGEPLVPDLPLQIGSQRAVTDSAGRFSAWALFPYLRVPLAVDSMRISDPSWTLAKPFIEVTPAPNAAIPVSVPLVRTRELAGSIVAQAPIPTAGGITLIISPETGSAVSAVTFSDGTFYLSRLRPGRYTLTISPAALQVLNAQPPPPVEFTIPAAGEDPLVELPPIRLLPR